MRRCAASCRCCCWRRCWRCWSGGSQRARWRRCSASPRRCASATNSRWSPLPTTDLPDEVAPLVSALNALLQRLGQSLETQRAFVADAAHELRSPLTALKLQLELLKRAGDEAGASPCGRGAERRHRPRRPAGRAAADAGAQRTRRAGRRVRADRPERAGAPGGRRQRAVRDGARQRTGAGRRRAGSDRLRPPRGDGAGAQPGRQRLALCAARRQGRGARVRERRQGDAAGRR